MKTMFGVFVWAAAIPGVRSTTAQITARIIRPPRRRHLRLSRAISSAAASDSALLSRKRRLVFSQQMMDRVHARGLGAVLDRDDGAPAHVLRIKNDLGFSISTGLHVW